MKELIYARYVGHLGDMGGVGDVRDIDLGIGTCLTVFFTKVTDLLSDRTDYRDAIASKKHNQQQGNFPSVSPGSGHWAARPGLEPGGGGGVHAGPHPQERGQHQDRDHQVHHLARAGHGIQGGD